MTKTKDSLPKRLYDQFCFILADFFGIVAAYNHDANEQRMRALGYSRYERERVRDTAMILALCGMQGKDLPALLALYYRTSYADLNDNTKEVAEWRANSR